MSQSRSMRRRVRRRRRARGSVLAALTSSALALPGLVPQALADAPVDRWSLDYATSFYSEDDLDSSKAAPGSETSRYEIETHQLALTAPVTDRTDFGLQVAHEIMSGATPWFVEPDANGEPVQVMSGATIEDARTDVLARGSLYFDNAKLSLSSGVSTENDYFALNGGLQGETHLNEKNTTLGGGIGFSLDRIEPTDADLFATRPDEEDKQSYSMFGSIAQVVGRESAIQSSLSFQHGRGFLSDPYKLVSVGGVNVADSRPSTRNGLSWLTRYRSHFSSLKGTLHADYRLYLDDWDVTSHTLELAWYQTLWDSLRLIPSLRYYSQSQAEFYGPFFAAMPSDGYASSDYRLSPYGAFSWRLKAEALLRDWPFHMDWRVGVAWERYTSSGDLALGDVEVENPGLVSFNLFTINLTARF